MKHRILPSFVSASVLVMSSLPVLAQEDPLSVLKPLVGTWKTVTEARPSQQNPEKSMGTGELAVTSILNDKFLHYAGIGTSPSIGRLEFHAMMTYDERQKTYRRWVFRSDGITAESTGVWDADTKTMTWTNIGLPENVKITATTTIAKDGIKETLYGKRSDGTVLIDLSLTGTKAP